MCAAGTLNVNAYGYPTLVLKVLNCLLAGIWLILNHADNRADDYPLIRKKYALLLLSSAARCSSRRPSRGATSCSLKAERHHLLLRQPLQRRRRPGLAAGWPACPSRPMQAAFFGSLAISAALRGLVFLIRRGGRGWLASLSRPLACRFRVAA